MKISVAIILLVSSCAVETAQALKCGTRLTTACLGDTDIRYDSTYTNDLMLQHPLWSHETGFWKVTSTSFQQNGNPTFAIPYNEETGTFGTGSLKNFVNATFFFNNTVTESRIIRHAVFTFKPIPCSIFAAGPPQGIRSLQNDDNDGSICGVNGYGTVADLYGTSTYEKNGDGRIFKGTGFYQSVVNNFERPIDEMTKYTVSRDKEDKDGNVGVQISGDIILYDNFTKMVSSATVYNFFQPGVNPFQLNTNDLFEKLEEEEWINEINAAYDANNITQMQRIQLPMTTECLVKDQCATEEEFCTIGKDPNCSKSPYQEPAATLNGAGIAVIVVCVLFVMAVILISVYKYITEAQKKRYRTKFARGVAKTLQVKTSVKNLSAEELQKAFQKMDNENKGGRITKEGLKEFTNTGYMGEIDDRDFEALWTAMDLDGDGMVDYLEFCVFLGQCADEYDVQKNRESVINRVSTRISLTSSNLDRLKDLEPLEE